MPFTPLHLGFGTIIKAILPNSFNFSAFALTQIIIDVESLYNLLNRKWPVHAFLHTYVGASIVALLVILFCWLLLNPLLRFWNNLHKRKEGSRLYFGERISLISLVIGSFFGAYSHVFLDSIMHSDIRPLAPYSDSNILYHIISVPILHMWCILALSGGVWMLHLILIGKYKA